MNKSRYFYSNSISYFLSNEESFYSKKDAIDFQKLNSSNSYLNIDYPLLHKFNNSNVLGPFFNRFDSAPNIVILIVEGLNDDFLHNYRGIDMMPFLNKLKDESLYWNRCFTLGERSFAVMPSLTGSLPYGEKGFTLLDVLPNHFSLVSILGSNDYYTSFFYGQGSWFHKKDQFFKFNNIDLIFDNSRFDGKYKKIIVGKDNFFWGYNDKDLFNQSLEVIDTVKAKQRLDIYFTGTSHSPYIISDNEHYENKFSEILKSIKNANDITFLKTYKKYILSEFFVNDALEDFFNNYKKRTDYERTIFIITGDHPTTEIPRLNSLKRYHVPLIIFSPKLKEAKTFSKTVGHLDIYESILSLLSDYNIRMPDVSAALGTKLNIDESDKDVKIAFMNDNREIVDYLSNDFFLSGKQLYSVNNDLSLSESTDKNMKVKLQKELKLFKKTSLFVSLNNKILPDSLYYKYLNYNSIYYQHSNVPTKFSAEFYDIIKTTEISNRSTFYDVSFDYSAFSNTGISVVYQLMTGKDSTLLWQNSVIEKDNMKFKNHLKIPRQNISDSLIYVKIYFWNNTKQILSFRNLNVSIYQ